MSRSPALDVCNETFIQRWRGLYAEIKAMQMAEVTAMARDRTLETLTNSGVDEKN